jgi:hypothetical protein
MFDIFNDRTEELLKAQSEGRLDLKNFTVREEPMRTCTTHHTGCDCREAKFEECERRLKRACEFLRAEKYYGRNELLELADELERPLEGEK